MPKKTLAIFLVCAYLFNSGFAYSAEPLTLDALIEEARKNNPELLAAKKRYDAAKARIPQAKSLEDPAIGITFEKIPRNTFQLNNAMPEDRMISLGQFIPWFGKLPLKGKIALVESQMFLAEYKDKELEVINAVKNAYYDLFMNYKEEELNRENLELLKGLSKFAEAKYSVGHISQEEVYKIHLEIARLDNTVRNLGEEKKAKETMINTLLNRGPDGSLGAPSLKEDTSFNTDIRSLYRAVVLNQPELIIFSYAIEKNKYAKALSKKSFFPDLMASIVQRGFAAGTLGPWDLMLSFTLPLWFWTKQRYEVKEAVANLEEAEAAYKAMQNKAFAEVKDLAQKIEVAKNKAGLYKSNLIPILESTIQVSLAAFQSGKGEFMALLDNQRMLIETKMDYYKALVEYNMNVADLERAVGISLTQEVGK